MGRWSRCLLAFVVAIAALRASSGAGETSPSGREASNGRRREGERDGESLPAPQPPPHPPAGQRTTPAQRTAFPPTSWSSGPEPRSREGEEEEVNGGRCWADDEECGDQCKWSSDIGAIYDLQQFSGKTFQTSVQSLKGSVFRFSLCSPLTCDDRRSHTCLSVPGVKLTSTGNTVSLAPLEPHLPGRGFKLVLMDGDVCEKTGRPRTTTVVLPCNPNSSYRALSFAPQRVMEGAKENVCRYTVEFPASQFGCPVAGESGDSPTLTAVQGCTDSLPPHTTEDCHYAARTQLSLHGLNLHLLCPDVTHLPRLPSSQCSRHFKQHYTVYVGPYKCRDPTILSYFILNCTVDKGRGRGLDVVVYRNSETENLQKEKSEMEGKGVDVMVLEAAVSFKEVIDFREKFAKFSELGVGGLKREIDELYRRAFASRGVSQDILEKMGITHVKGILLYGPPGTGKTLIARTIAKILGSKQVQLINGPEIISKYLGESERNLRAHFEAAQKAWKEHGALSELYVIIIDEIDAICKPRGKTDQSAAGVAYDALVNQLLTLMDGLNEAHNTLVVGLTNRRELLDSALLRPGRFEVQIDVSLPDEGGRREIFEIHTRSMRSEEMLASDVDLGLLAGATSRFSGAEIAGVVRAASAYALERYQSDESSEDTLLVRAADFDRAILSVNPAYTHSEAQVSSMYLPNGYISCGAAHDAVVDLALDLLYMMKHSSTSQLQTLLLYGPRGSGKTALAAHLAVVGKFSFVKFLTASSVVGSSTLHKIETINAAFSDAFSSDLAMVVLDDLHRLVQYMMVGIQITVSHDLLHTLTTLLTSTLPPGAKVLVVGTLTVEEGESLDDPQYLGLPNLFLQHHHVPLLDCPAVLSFLNSSNIHRFKQDEQGPFSLPPNLTMSIRQLLHAIECACAQGSCSVNRKLPSVVSQEHLLDCIMAYVTRQMAELDTEV